MLVDSIAKPLVATGLLKLASDGRVDLDAPVNRYLPALAFDSRWQDSPVRVRHRPDHTAGLDDALYVVTAALPLLMGWHAWRSLRRRQGLARGRRTLVAALLSLQWCGVLLAWDMLPFAPWH